MKKVMFLLAGAFVAIGALYAHQPASTQADILNAAFSWNATVHDFGKIRQAVPVSHEFVFTNDGTEALMITSVTASCGCTVAEYSKGLIQPGETGFVKATYNAAKAGVFTKTVTVNANTEEGVVKLTIKGEVVGEKETL